jgi:hypothetical protein
VNAAISVPVSSGSGGDRGIGIGDGPLHSPSEVRWYRKPPVDGRFAANFGARLNDRRPKWRCPK